MKKMRLLGAFLLLMTSTIGFCERGKIKTAEEDTIIVTFGKKGKMVIYVDNKEDFKALKSYDLNALLSKINIYLDSTYQEDYMNDTTFTFHSPYSISTTTSQGEVKVRVETFDDRVAAIERNLEEAAENLEEATKEMDKVKMRIGSIHIDINPSEEDEDKVKVYHKKAEPKRVKYGFNLYVGLNNYFENGKIPNYENAPYGLSTFRSRYFAIDFKQTVKIAGPLHLSTGVELAFNNYMFNDEITIAKDNGMISFPVIENDTRKSKLATTYLNVPVMAILNPYGKITFGVGGYVGHRISSHSKIKYATGSKEKDRSNFYLNDWKYGVRGLVNFYKVNLFINYDLSPLFIDKRGPELNAFSFGIII